jgi:hypothetical protein
MKRFAWGAVLTLGLVLLAGGKASAAGYGNGTYGISPGSFSIGVGLNIAWSGVSFGHVNNGGCGPCYGAGPQMYDGYGYGGGGYYGGYYGYPAYGYGGGGYGPYNGGYGGYYPGNNAAPYAPHGPQGAPTQQGAPAQTGPTMGGR